jgi:hypothetical protein
LKRASDDDDDQLLMIRKEEKVWATHGIKRCRLVVTLSTTVGRNYTHMYV